MPYSMLNRNSFNLDKGKHNVIDNKEPLVGG